MMILLDLPNIREAVYIFRGPTRLDAITLPFLKGKGRHASPVWHKIRLRAAEKTDIETFCRWVNDPDVTENLMLVFPMSQVEEERWYENMLQRHPATTCW
jgi:RimJ/RimL family protein N-acetyltransferase